jgi:hypothetical protein
MYAFEDKTCKRLHETEKVQQSHDSIMLKQLISC